MVWNIRRWSNKLRLQHRAATRGIHFNASIRTLDSEMRAHGATDRAFVVGHLINDAFDCLLIRRIEFWHELFLLCAGCWRREQHNQTKCNENLSIASHGLLLDERSIS